jgi:hypothetical protein
MKKKELEDLIRESKEKIVKVSPEKIELENHFEEENRNE